MHHFQTWTSIGNSERVGTHVSCKDGRPGIVEISTTEDLSRLDSLILVHPWIDFLLDKRPLELLQRRSLRRA
jgi:hypothetical protein